MIDAVPEKKIVKINATIDDDINLILDAIIKVEAAYVMLVLPEGNDLANSPIGLKALRKKTLEKGKRMVLVVPKGSGYELAKKAGFIASVSQDAVTGDVWQTVNEQYDEYKQSQAGMNSKKEQTRQLEKPEVEYIAPVAKANLPVPEIIRGGATQTSPEESESEVAEGESEKKKMVEPPKIKESEEPKKDTKQEPSEREKMAAQNVTGMDFSKFVKSSPKSFWGKPKAAPMSANTIVAPNEVNTFHPDIVPKKVGATLGKVGKKGMSGVAKIILFGLIACLLLGGGVFAAWYAYFPKIRIELQLQSTMMSVSEQVLATSAVTGFDVNRKEVQLTKERVEKNATQSFTATEKSADGTKATGTITVSSSGPVTIQAGTLVTIKTKKFSVTTQTVANGASNLVPVTASDFGTDYNLEACALPSECDIDVAKSGIEPIGNSAFTGGTKREFTVVGQKDVDAATKELQTELGKQGEADLMYMNMDKGYEFIPESVKTEVKDKVAVSPAVGKEVKEAEEDPNISMTTVTTALYYHRESLEIMAERLLLDKYKIEKNLSLEAAALTQINKNELKVTVEKITVDKDEKVTITFSATGLVTSRVDVDKIRNDVAGKKWPEMLEYLSKLPALARAPEVLSFPTWLPEYARYVPGEVSRVDVRVRVVPPEPTTTPEAE